jgi:hypothetical protein
LDDKIRPYVAAHFAVEIGKNVVGFARQVEGLTMANEPLVFKHASTQTQTVQGGKLKYTDLKIQAGMGFAPLFYDKIAAFVRREGGLIDGAVVTGDFHYNERSRRTFLNGMISSVGFPVLDANGKDPAYLSTTIVPGTVSYVKGDKAQIECADSLRQPAKLWLSQNFVLRIDGLEEATAQCSKIDAFEIKQTIIKYDSGPVREPLLVPGRLEYPQITFYVPASSADPLLDLAVSRSKSFQADGGMTGSIEFLSNEKEVLGTVTLEGIQILSADAQPSSSTQDQIHLVKVTLGIESMTFAYEKAAVATS